MITESILWWHWTGLQPWTGQGRLYFGAPARPAGTNFYLEPGAPWLRLSGGSDSGRVATWDYRGKKNRSFFFQVVPWWPYFLDESSTDGSFVLYRTNERQALLRASLYRKKPRITPGLVGMESRPPTAAVTKGLHTPRATLRWGC